MQPQLPPSSQLSSLHPYKSESSSSVYPQESANPHIKDESRPAETASIAFPGKEQSSEQPHKTPSSWRDWSAKIFKQGKLFKLRIPEIFRCRMSANQKSADTTMRKRANDTDSQQKSLERLSSSQQTHDSLPAPSVEDDSFPSAVVRLTADSTTQQAAQSVHFRPAKLSLNKHNRSYSGFKLRDKLGSSLTSSHKQNGEAQQHRELNKRAVSIHLGSDHYSGVGVDSEIPPLQRQPWAMPAGAGAGLKARRISVNLPDDFNVDVVNLHSEFAYQSRILGKHGKVLGKGATSTVALMHRKGSTGDLYAVKQFRGKHRSEQTEYHEKKVKSEFSIAKSLHHPNIVETIRLCIDKGRWNHVMEYCPGGDLFGLVKNGYLRADNRAVDRHCLFKQLAQGIQYLHRHGIAHRDIKLENILINSQSKLKITDFGVSEVFSGIHPGLRSAAGECGRDMNEIRLCSPGICGSMPYIAPEVVSKQSDYDPRPLDVWSAAIVMLHIVCGGALWPKAESGNAYYESLIKGWALWEEKHGENEEMSDMEYPHVAAFDKLVKPPALRRLLLGMLHPDPRRRKTIENVLGNRWLKRMECCQMNGYDCELLEMSVIDVSKKNCCESMRAIHHDHLPPKPRSHAMMMLPGSDDD